MYMAGSSKPDTTQLMLEITFIWDLLPYLPSSPSSFMPLSLSIYLPLKLLSCLTHFAFTLHNAKTKGGYILLSVNQLQLNHDKSKSKIAYTYIGGPLQYHPRLVFDGVVSLSRPSSFSWGGRKWKWMSLKGIIFIFICLMSVYILNSTHL